uniref:SFRICE_022021 n=1 Tax=Spodoptera frugiperda TaxID=7108 RepID=A0A2H1X262_SPOFR
MNGHNNIHSQLTKSLERILEDAYLSGELKLSGRKLREFPKPVKYDLSDTVVAVHSSCSKWQNASIGDRCSRVRSSVSTLRIRGTIAPVTLSPLISPFTFHRIECCIVTDPHRRLDDFAPSRVAVFICISYANISYPRYLYHTAAEGFKKGNVFTVMIEPRFPIRISEKQGPSLGNGLL